MANLKNYFETELASMETRITDAYGFSTAIIIKDFIDSFYYAQDIAYIDEAFYDFADENTAINDCYLYDWLTADNASENFFIVSVSAISGLAAINSSYLRTKENTCSSFIFNSSPK